MILLRSSSCSRIALKPKEWPLSGCLVLDSKPSFTVINGGLPSRQSSGTGVPASTCLMMAMIWLFEYLDFFMPNLLPTGDENIQLKTSVNLWGDYLSLLSLLHKKSPCWWTLCHCHKLFGEVSRAFLPLDQEIDLPVDPICIRMQLAFNFPRVFDYNV